MTNAHPLRNSTPEQRGKDALYKLLEGEADFGANNRSQWLAYGAALNEIKAKHGKDNNAFGAAVAAAGLDVWPQGGPSKLEEPLHPAIRTAAMWAASLTPAELAGHEAAHPNTRVTRDSGFRGLHKAVKDEVKEQKATKKAETPVLDDAKREAERMAKETGKPVKGAALAKKMGVARGTGDTAAAAVNARLEALEEFKKNPPIDVSALPMTAQQKVESAIRQEVKKLRAEYIEVFNKAKEEAAAAEKERVDHMISVYLSKQKRAEEIIKAYDGVMTVNEFKTIKRCLHPDSRNSVSDEMLARAFDILNGRKIRLLPGAES